ncbi:MAG: hypothetical protein ACPLYX_01960 [Rectinema subterraneum]|uniref:hypothetical protein n=1 Tax=Rectinema subterraneum TaxID=2653714 RepID=UPI003C7E7176
MQRFMGKTRKAGLVAAFIILLFYANAMNAEAQPTLEAQFLYANAWTWTSATAFSRHTGYAFSLDAQWLFPLRLSSGAQEENRGISLLFAAGVHAQHVNMAASVWLADGSRYRAWNALGFGPEVGVGIQSAGLSVGRKQIFALSAGPIANFSNYTSTTLYNAYWSGYLKLSWEAEIGRHWALNVSLPMEIGSRSDGTSVIAALGVGVRYVF